MASTNPYAEGKEHLLFVYDTPMAFQIHFCLTIIGMKPYLILTNSSEKDKKES